MVLGISVHDVHVVNTVSPIMTEVTDHELSLLFRGLWWQSIVPVGCACGPGWLFLRPLHGAICKDVRVVAHVRGDE